MRDAALAVARAAGRPAARPGPAGPASPCRTRRAERSAGRRSGECRRRSPTPAGFRIRRDASGDRARQAAQIVRHQFRHAGRAGREKKPFGLDRSGAAASRDASRASASASHASSTIASIRAFAAIAARWSGGSPGGQTTMRATVPSSPIIASAASNCSRTSRRTLRPRNVEKSPWRDDSRRRSRRAVECPAAGRAGVEDALQRQRAVRRHCRRDARSRRTSPETARHPTP